MIANILSDYASRLYLNCLLWLAGLICLIFVDFNLIDKIKKENRERNILKENLAKNIEDLQNLLDNKEEIATLYKQYQEQKTISKDNKCPVILRLINQIEDFLEKEGILKRDIYLSSNFIKGDNNLLPFSIRLNIEFDNILLIEKLSSIIKQENSNFFLDKVRIELGKAWQESFSYNKSSNNYYGEFIIYIPSFQD